MFTGLVRELGEVERVGGSASGARLRIAAGLVAELHGGDSIAVDGVCLTASSIDAGAFEADVMNVTLERTTLGSLEAGGRVNLEPALRLGDPLGGHLVQGHVDGTGRVRGIAADGAARRLSIEIPEDLRGYVVERGSIAIDGVSLTVAERLEDGFGVSLIPETLERTTLGGRGPGDRVNVELDVIARYVERLMQPLKPES